MVKLEAIVTQQQDALAKETSDRKALASALEKETDNRKALASELAKEKVDRRVETNRLQEQLDKQKDENERLSKDLQSKQNRIMKEMSQHTADIKYISEVRNLCRLYTNTLLSQVISSL